MKPHRMRNVRRLTFAVATSLALAWFYYALLTSTQNYDVERGMEMMEPRGRTASKKSEVSSALNSSSSLTEDVQKEAPPLVETKVNHDRNRNSKTEDTQQFYLMTMLSVSNGHIFPGYEQFTEEDLLERDEEYLGSLEHNINHPSVKQVHLFYRDSESLRIVEAKNYRNKEKIIPVEKKGGVYMSDFFLYASKHLLDKPVIALNGDIMLGENFDKINTTRLRDETVLYSLSRYNVVDGETCEPKNMKLPPGYLISHDTHIFRLAEPLNETLILDKLDYPINMWGAENAMIWTFKYTLKWTVRNPCKVLTTYHNHCSKVHGPSLAEIKKTKYSILYLPNKGWNDSRIRESIVRYENRLSYGE